MFLKVSLERAREDFKSCREKLNEGRGAVQGPSDATVAGGLALERLNEVFRRLKRGCAGGEMV